MSRWCVFLMVLLFVGCSEQQQKENVEEVPAERPQGAASPRALPIKFDLAPSKDPGLREKGEKIREYMKKHRDFNGCVLVASKGKIVFDTAMGYANFDTKSRLSIHSSFHLASVSKQFTATAVMLLHQEKKLNYDDKVTTYLKDFPYKEITIRQLLNHTSGIPNILNYIPHFLSYWDSCEMARNVDILQLFKTKKPPLHSRPGARFSYNNTGYVILAILVEHISGIPFEQFLEERIFMPLQMEDTKVFGYYSNTRVRNRVYGFHKARNWHCKDEDDIRNGLVGEKGIYSSVIDLYKWDQGLRSGLLIPVDSLKEAYSYAKLNNGREIKYGFGWRKPENDEKVVYHFGHWRGFNTCIMRFLDDNNLIVILNNTGSRRIKGMMHGITDILYDNKKELKL